MNILILGSGGREHAFAWKISKSTKCSHLYIAPGNPGTAHHGTNVDLSPLDFQGISEFCQRNNIELLIPGGEDALVKGITDFFAQSAANPKLKVFGPEKKGALLEGSKEFAKEFMLRHQIPTAKYRSFKKGEEKQALDFLQTLDPPYVLKADGLAAGKGVVIPETLKEAKKEVEEMLGGKFGDASATVVIEEFLKGIEVSVFIVTDGKNYHLLPEAKDYKRIGDGDTGLNTGGMGAVSPVPFADEAFMKKVEERIIKPTVAGFDKEKINYKGFVFFGLMNVGGEPYVIEYNVRMGDPETEAVLPRVESDLLEVIVAACEGKLQQSKLDISKSHAATVVCVSQGYPGSYEKGKEIHLEQDKGSIIFHSGTTGPNDKLLTGGGRVFAVTSLGTDLRESLNRSYKQVDKIQFEGKTFRKDIGKDLL